MEYDKEVVLGDIARELRALNANLERWYKSHELYMVASIDSMSGLSDGQKFQYMRKYRETLENVGGAVIKAYWARHAAASAALRSVDEANRKAEVDEENREAEANASPFTPEDEVRNYLRWKATHTSPPSCG